MSDKHQLCCYVRPSTADQELLKNLGLDVPLIEVGKEEILGEVSLKDQSFATVSVKATFAGLEWIFGVVCEPRKRFYVVQTGPGSFAKYWPTIKMMGNGLMTIQELSEEIFD